eukprot:TRINITY_DN93924_c0_g1_i1.p1 TRINITY_DN93924_c0_g1~~TRINITY_DN93924_c0_g1_i1.p1  ORF type:complete len:122 (+),score=16.85 TRINITY_DN93924_c0_g1_i1:99-464(+)
MSGAGLSSSSSMPNLSMSDQRPPEYLIPACFASHKALAKTFVRSPTLFSGGGIRLGGEMEKFRPAEYRNPGQSAKPYLRRQLLLPEVDNLRNSFSNDPWRGRGPKPSWAGEALEVIHKDMR